MKQPKSIDVIIPHFNNPHLIVETIESVLNQTLKPNKVIVVDDGSSKPAKEALQDFIIKGLVEYLEYTPNKGPNFARNFGLQHSTSEFVAFVDSDDKWLPNKLEEQMNVFENSEFKDLGVVYCGYEYIDEEGKIKYNADVAKIRDDVRGNVFFLLTTGNYVISSASGVLIKRKYIDEVGGFDENLRIGEDWEMWIRLSKVCSYDYVNKDLVQIRQHSGNHQSKRIYVFENEMKLYTKMVQDNEISKSAKRNWALHLINKMRQEFPKKELLKIANRDLNKTTKKILFDAGFGSIRLHIFRLSITQYLRFLFENFKQFLARTWETIIYIFSVITP